MGMELIDKNNLTEASARFDRAIALIPVCTGHGREGLGVGHQGGETEKDKDHQAVELGGGPLIPWTRPWTRQKGTPRVRSLCHGHQDWPVACKNWIDKAEKCKKALKLSKVKEGELPSTRPSSHYVMGMAYYRSGTGPEGLSPGPGRDCRSVARTC